MVNRNHQPGGSYGNSYSWLRTIELRNNQQTAKGFPFWDSGEARHTNRAWKQRAHRKARPQRSLPVRFRTQLL